MNNYSHICSFGLFKGQRYTSLPATFLNWMVQINHKDASIAAQELRRRERAAVMK